MSYSFSFRSALTKEMEMLEKNCTRSSQGLKIHTDLPNREYLEGLNDGTLATIRIIRDLMEVYKED